MLVIRWGGSPSSAFLFRSGWTGSDGPASVVNSSMQIPPPSLTALAESKSQGESLATRFVSHSTMTCSSAFGDAAMTRVEGGNFLSCMDIADFVTNQNRVFEFIFLRRANFSNHIANSLSTELISRRSLAFCHRHSRCDRRVDSPAFLLVFHESLMIVAYCEDWRGRQR